MCLASPIAQGDFTGTKLHHAIYQRGERAVDVVRVGCHRGKFNFGFEAGFVLGFGFFNAEGGGETSPGFLNECECVGVCGACRGEDDFSMLGGSVIAVQDSGFDRLGMSNASIAEGNGGPLGRKLQIGKSATKSFRRMVVHNLYL
jgi:hypothetical protein